MEASLARPHIGGVESRIETTSLNRCSGDFMQIRARVLSALVILLIAPSTLGQKDLSAKQQKSHISPKEISEKEIAFAAVDSAAHIASRLAPELRGFLLSSAAGTIAKTKPATAIRYYRSAFDAAQQMTLLDPFNLRMGVQEGVVAGLASVDTDKAAELLMLVDRPQWTGYPSDDFRTHSATLIAGRLIQRNAKNDIDKIIDLLDYLGQTGQYPYRAGNQLIQFLHTKGQDVRAADVFSQALGYFERDDQFLTSPNALADLVIANANNLPGHSLVRAIRLIVEKARGNEESQAQAKESADHSRFLINSPKGTLTVNRRSTYLALCLLPLARRLDAALAAELAKKDADLDNLLKTQSPEELSNWSNGTLATLHGDPNQGQFQEFQQLIGEQRVLTDIEAKGGSNAGEAIALSKNIHRPDLHVLALAAIAKSLVPSDPHRAAALLGEAEANLENVTDSQKKAEAIAPIASIWEQLNDKKRASSLLSEGFSRPKPSWKKRARTKTLRMKPFCLDLPRDYWYG